MFNRFTPYEQDFEAWRREGYPGVREATYRYLEYLTDPNDDLSPRAGTLWRHQWEASCASSTATRCWARGQSASRDCC
jgi:hypothetical protein